MVFCYHGAMSRNFPKLIFFAVAAAYFVVCAADRQGYHFFDNVDLAIHEAGHVLFSPFGEFLQVAGGSILQLLVPLVFAAYFFIRADRFSGSTVLLWLGQSFTDVARYAADAQKMDLPLLGQGMHDWNYLLSQTNMLDSAVQVGNVFYYAGIAIIYAGIIIGLLSFFRSNEPNCK
jgi:hypothetical protein